jgi:type IX secretion system PorP/SprF family membrane protein
MKFFKHLLFVIVLLSATNLQAQYQLIFTQYQMSPLTLNPALTGAYEGTYRVGGIARQQWPIVNATYSTQSLFVDAPLLMIGKRHWIGAGFMYWKDVAKASVTNSSVSLNQSVFALSGSFHYALDKKYKNVLSFGLQAAGGSRLIALDGNPIFYSEFDKAGSQATERTELTSPNNKKTYLDINAGLLLKSVIDKKSNITLGLAMSHINGPKYSLLATNKDKKLQSMLTAHIEYNRVINKKLSIMPSFLFRSIAGSHEVAFQGVVGYKIDPVRKPDLVLKGGLGFRPAGNNAICLLLGADYKNYRFGLGYDITTGAPSGAVQNTLELSLHYTGKKYKKPNVTPEHFCPKY